MNVALSLTHLVKHFGTVRATDGVSLDVREGECHAIIGPNGAGKSTLIGLITAEIKPDQGRVMLFGRDVTDVDVAGRAHLGLGRSFQITHLILDMSVLENVMLAVMARYDYGFQFFTDISKEERLRAPAYDVLHQVGLSARAHDYAQNLSHGERRQLELAMALALKPRLLVLDEPMAGMGPHESAAMVERLRDIGRDLSIILVEHDMDVVFALADRISVLVGGQILRTAGVDDIRADPRVRAAYLGEDS
jgi:branched-chain amino acid transport system ATP-binding protein